ncbi:MAG TPA: efflux RND transporter periplasmic adaptor subunit [Candidatus Binatia bacterium]|nr:efflux RND transporter periplasmic adaptor subunit [Candidatus Binatia bacterium]
MSEMRSPLRVSAEVPADGSSVRAWRRTAAIAGIAGVLVLAAVVAYRSRRREEEQPHPFTVAGDTVTIPDGSPSWRFVELAEASVAERVPVEPEPARVAFDEARSSPVFAPLAGRVESVSALLGQRVREGDRLVSIRSAALVDLFKERDVERTREAAKAKELERVRALVGLHALPEKDLVAAEQDLREERLAREASERKLSSLSVSPEGEEVYWLTAPRSGVVVERAVLRGDEVGPDRASPLLVVADLDEVVVTADVPESRVAQLRVGQEAGVTWSGGDAPAVTGRIEYVGEVIDPQRRMVSVRVRVANPEHALRPNAFVQVAFSESGPRHVVVDSEAVVTDDRKAFVFVRPAGRADALDKRFVKTGWERDGKVEILSGLEPGETYARKGAVLLQNAIDLAN